MGEKKKRVPHSRVKQEFYEAKPKEGTYVFVSEAEFFERDPRPRQILSVAQRFVGKASRILDVGCGDGAIAMRVAQALKADQVYGIEISRDYAEQAERRGIKTLLLDIEENGLPFNSGFFDFVVAAELIEHLFDTDYFIEEAARVTKPSGYVLLTTPNLAWWLNRIVFAMGYQPYSTEPSSADCRVGKYQATQEKTVGHLRLFTARALKEIMRNHNLQIVHLAGCPYPFSNRLSAAVDSWLSRRAGLAYKISCLARKPSDWRPTGKISWNKNERKLSTELS